MCSSRPPFMPFAICGLAAAIVLAVTPLGAADVVTSDPVEITVVANFTGTSIDVVTGMPGENPPSDDQADLILFKLSGEWRMANLDWFEGGGLIGNDAGDRAKLMQPGDVVEVRPDQPLLPGGGIRTFGDFDDVESAFVGLFFENEATGTLHHGWVQLTLPSSGNGVITRFAYESDPETPILIPSPCPADIDRDGQVAFDDLLATLSSFGPCTACPEDLDGTGDVSFDDVLAVLAAWGPCPE